VLSEVLWILLVLFQPNEQPMCIGPADYIYKAWNRLNTDCKRASDVVLTQYLYTLLTLFKNINSADQLKWAPHARGPLCFAHAAQSIATPLRRISRPTCKLVRQRVPDRRTSDRKRPRAVCVETTARYDEPVSVCTLQNADEAEKRRLRLWWDGRRGTVKTAV